LPHDSREQALDLGSPRHRHRHRRVGDQLCRRRVARHARHEAGSMSMTAIDQQIQDEKQISEPLLSVRDLAVEFAVDDRRLQAVRSVDFDIAAGETVAVVGESGSGKSVTMNAVMRLLTGPAARITSGSVTYRGVDLMSLSEREMRKYRGKEIAMIFQDPSMSFNPVQTIGWQIVEAIRVHNRGMSNKKATERAIELLDLVGVPSPRVRVSQYPHEFSGGMRQRAMIAMALANEPSVLIADE